jgi:hypothetical protein
MPQEGMLHNWIVLPQAWLESGGPPLTLLLAIDDPTGTVPCALFREREDTVGYFELLKVIIDRYGITLGVYTDRDSIPRVEKSPGNGNEELCSSDSAWTRPPRTGYHSHTPS